MYSTFVQERPHPEVIFSFMYDILQPEDTQNPIDRNMLEKYREFTTIILVVLSSI
jgi:preprotein translocase subunit SecY